MMTMLEIWRMVGVYILIFIFGGCLCSAGLFVKRVWDHVNKPHATVNCGSVNGGEVSFSGDMKVNISQGIRVDDAQ